MARAMPRWRGGKDGAGDGHADGHGGAATHRLHHPGADHPLEAGRDGYENGPCDEDDQGGLVYPGVPVDVAQASHQRHSAGITDQEGGDDPRGPVQLGNRDFQVYHHLGQSGDDHGLIEGRHEGAQPDDHQDQRGRHRMSRHGGPYRLVWSIFISSVAQGHVKGLVVPTSPRIPAPPRMSL